MCFRTMERVLVWLWGGALELLALETLVVLLSRALSLGTHFHPPVFILCRRLWSLADLDYPDSKVRAPGLTGHVEIWGKVTSNIRENEVVRLSASSG